MSKCCGDLDNLCPYLTVKYVAVRDGRLGMLQKVLMLLIFLRIVIQQILMQNVHLLEVPITGSMRAAAQQPTKDGCNPLREDCLSDFTKLSQLPYCQQYASNESSQPVKVARCEYWDAVTMTRGRTPVPGTLFLPSRVTTVKQQKGCTPALDNGFGCDSKPWVRDGNSTDDVVFVADLDRFRLIFNQAFQSDTSDMDMDIPITITGNAVDYQGYIDGADGMTKVFRLKDARLGHHHPNGSALETLIPHHRPDVHSIFSSAVSHKYGDELSIKDILNLADPRGALLLDARRTDGTTMRHEGSVIELNVEWTNKAPWDFLGKQKPHYTYRARLLPMREYRIAYDVQLDDEHRLARDVHGFLVVMQVHGSIRVFDVTHFLTILTTALVALSLAATLTDYIMMYLLPLRTVYTSLKYQNSEDFSEYVAAMSRIKRTGGPQYQGISSRDAEKHTLHGSILANCVMSKKPPEGNDLLHVLVKFEQRLNRLDAVDIEVAHMPPSDSLDDAATMKLDPQLAYIYTGEETFKKST